MYKYNLAERATRAGPLPVNAQLSTTIFLNPCYSVNAYSCLQSTVRGDDSGNETPVYFSSEAGTYTKSGERNNVSYF